MRARWLASILPGAALLALGGCGQDSGLVTVSGTVLIDGKPLTYGYVLVAPDNARPAGGNIDSQGRFTLTPFDARKGCPKGTHKAAIIAVETLSPSTQRWHAPKKYRDPLTSGLTVTITEPTDSLEIKLTWEGGQPFVEGTGVSEKE
jgi:hypothetical protein